MTQAYPTQFAGQFDQAGPAVPLAPVPAVPTGPAPAAAGRALPTIGVDPGTRWTGVVLRLGDHAVTGFTLGPTNRNGVVQRDALSNADDWLAFVRYADKVVSHIEALVTYAEQEYGAGIRLGVETANVPAGWKPDRQNTWPNKLPVADVLALHRMIAAVIGAYPSAKCVPPNHWGNQDLDRFPPELKGRRPPHWGPNETFKGERDHERAAYMIAGEAVRMA